MIILCQHIHDPLIRIQWEEELINIVIDNELRRVSIVTVAYLQRNLLLKKPPVIRVLHVNDIQNTARHKCV